MLPVEPCSIHVSFITVYIAKVLQQTGSVHGYHKLMVVVRNKQVLSALKAGSRSDGEVTLVFERQRS